ncbi:MAG: putative baseplate assembly protein, partial [Anaerolineae bacterium]|nr:putative baseplate assembly protein [Anaerolineae bacterium]
MALPKPKLDDRQFQDIVDEAKKRIPHFSKEWTDHNVSDPGITIIELFAWMTDIILYRLNQIPDLHYISFMDMLGIKLQEPVPAKAPVTFWLSQPQPTPVTIPAGTEVASTQTETERSIVFTTNKDLRVDPPEWVSVCSRSLSRDGKNRSYHDQSTRRLENGFGGFEIYSPIPQNDDAIYFGFTNDLSHHILGFDMDFDPAGGAGIDPTMPPYVWEASSGRSDIRWNRCDVEMDSTNGMNTAGRVQIHLPAMGKYEFGKGNHYWVRARIRKIEDREKA